MEERAEIEVDERIEIELEFVRDKSGLRTV
jgi:hypothetical protein